MARWIREEEREGLDMFFSPRGKKRTSKWELQGGRFQLDWTVFDEGNEPLVTKCMKKNLYKHLPEISGI